MKRALYNLVLACILLQLCGCKSASTHATEGSIKQVSAALDSLFASRFQADEPGAAILMVRADSVVYDHSIGLARLDIPTPITNQTMFNICSVSKQFSAMALFMLAEQGKLSLDDSVNKYFPHFRADFYKQITLRHLLSHTSGLPDNRPRNEKAWLKYIQNNKTRFKNVHDFTHHAPEEESYRFLELLDTLAFEPGTQYDYQNPTYQLMQSIIEQVTGESFDKWMQENIFLPAGMKETCYFEPNKEIARMAHGYIPAEGANPYNYYRTEDGRWEECDYGETSFFRTKADGGIYTTPLEFLLWDKALYGDLLVSDSVRKEAHTARIETDIPYTSYGYGWFIEHRPDRPLKIYHTGDNGGFLIFEGRFPEKDIFYLIFANRPDWEREATVEEVDKILEKYGWI